MTQPRDEDNHRLHALVIGASTESLHAIGVARELGFRITALDGNPDAAGLQAADDAIVLDITSPSRIIEVLSEAPDVVLPVPIGRYLTSTGAVNDHYGLTGISASGAAHCTDKYEFHQLMTDAGLRSVICLLIPAGASPETVDVPHPAFPVVLKPRFGSGSREVVICGSPSELRAHLDRLLPAGEDLIVEGCAQGTEYGADAVVIDGEYRTILLREKINTPLPHRQAVGYYTVPADHEMQSLTTSVLSQAVHVLGIENGLLHADLIHQDGRAFVIELSARPSGHHLHDLFTPLATGVDPIREFLKLAVPGLGQPSFTPKTDRPMLLRFFDFDGATITGVPDVDDLRGKVELVAYEEHCLGRSMGPVTNGPGLMSRGFFALAGKDRDDLDTQCQYVFSQFTLERNNT